MERRVIMKDEESKLQKNKQLSSKIFLIVWLVTYFLLPHSTQISSPAYAAPCVCCCSVTCGQDVFECGQACACQSDTETTDVDLGSSPFTCHDAHGTTTHNHSHAASRNHRHIL